VGNKLSILMMKMVDKWSNKNRKINIEEINDWRNLSQFYVEQRMFGKH
jgi:glutaredoxin-related protein